MTAEPNEPRAPLRWLTDPLSDWRFPSFMLTALTLAQLLLATVLLVPASEGAMGEFAVAFKTWCFGYDPATGTMEWIYPIMLLVNPLVLDLVILTVWWVPLREIVHTRPRALLGPAACAAVLVTACGLGMLALEPEAPGGELPFPAEELRTAQEPPDFRLVDQDGQELGLADLRGRVVMVTAVYSTCGFTCPMIMGQSTRVLEQLTPAEREDVSVVAVTLDPERDSPQVLADYAQRMGFSAPLHRFLSGEPAAVEAALDRLDVTRRRDPETGVIDHANLFVLIDRQGRVAYRLTLGDRQEQWLLTAIRLLLREGRPVPPAG